MGDRKGVASWGSRFGFIMVAAGAAVGLGNIWKFPYLAYRGGGGVFLLLYVLIVILLARPMVEMETAIGRHGHSDAVSAFESVDKRWGFVGWISNACTLMINFYYVVVGGWVLRYAAQFIFVGDFGGNPAQFFTDFTSSTYEPLVWTFGLLAFVIILLLFGITRFVEKLTKVMMPVLIGLLVVCGVYACFSSEGAVEGLYYYFFPDFSKLSVKVFADAATQVLFSVGIGWGIFTTLGGNVTERGNLRKDARMISILDTAVAVLAGFVIIPTAFGAGVDVAKGPALVFDVMANIFLNLPGGRIIGSLFFVSLALAVVTSLFSFIEIAVRTLEIKLGLGRVRGVICAGVLIGAGNLLVSLGFGPLSGITLPWPSAAGIEWYTFFDWFDCCSGYVLLPLGCILVCAFTAGVWKWDGYEAELTVNGRDGRLTAFDKVRTTVIIPLLMVVVLLNVFGFIS